MTDAAKKLLDDALGLPPDDRARLARALIASLDERDARTDSAWIQELERRAERVRAGQSVGSSWTDVRGRLLARFAFD